MNNNDNNNNTYKEKNPKLEKAIKLEIILIIIIIVSIPIVLNYINTPSNCRVGFKCLGETLFFILLTRLIYILIPVVIINSFVIQKMRKKSLLIPCIPIIIILIGYMLILEPKPEKNLYNIINNTKESNLTGEKELEYFIHDDNIYYYKYKESTLGLIFSLLNSNFPKINKLLTKRVLFKADINGKNSKKICTLNKYLSFEYNFIYKNEVYFITKEEGLNKSYHNSLKSLNLDTCEEKTIINNDEKTDNNWRFILNSKKNNEILFYDFNRKDEDKLSYVLYKYNLDTHKITKRKEVDDFISNYIDYNNFDEYKEKKDEKYENNFIYLNNTFMIKGEDLYILSFDNDNIYLHDNNNIYTLEKETKKIINKQKLKIDITRTGNNSYQNFFLADNKLYTYDTNKNAFKLIIKNIEEEEILCDIYNINDNYLFIDDYNIDNKENAKYNDKSPALVIYNKNSERIINEYNTGNLKEYRIDNDKIYLIYKDNSIKKIELK